VSGSEFQICDCEAATEKKAADGGKFEIRYFQAGAVLRWGRGAQAPPNVGQPPPPIFWFQQQKYALLKSRLFL